MCALDDVSANELIKTNYHYHGYQGTRWEYQVPVTAKMKHMTMPCTK
jgi:hypothetical protein